MSEEKKVEAATEAQVQVEKTATKAVVKTGNLIHDVAIEIEGLSKTKALNAAEKLIEEQGSNDFKLGGILKKILENSWFEGSESFDAFVAQRYGFQGRKARYLIDIYTHLTSKNIPWEKVANLGWSKLKDLAPILTLANLEEWIKKAEALTVLELQAALKANEPTAADESAKTTSDSTTWKVKLKKDQLDTVSSAIAKAKSETQTEFDSVALESICMGYMGGASAVAAPAQNKSFEELMKEIGWEGALTVFDKLFPKVNITVEPPEDGKAS